MTQSARDEFASGWRMLVACVVGVAFSITTMAVTYTLGSFVGPLTDEFGWTRQQILSVAIFTTAAFIPASFAAGWIVDRYGARRLVTLSQAAFGLGFIALGLWTRSLASFYALYFLLPLLAVGTTQTVFSKVLLRHFVKGRGLALGIALSGTGLCVLVMPSLLAWVIGEWGWRAGYVAAGLMPLLVALPFSLAWIHDAPQPAAAQAPAAGPEPAVPVGEPTVGVRQAMLGYRFWVLAAAFFVASGAATGLLLNVVPMLTDRGHDPVTAGAALSSVGLSVVVGRLLVGALVDRYWAPLVGALVLMPAGIAVAGLYQDSLSWSMTLALLVAAGMATGAETDLCAYLVSRYFGVRHFGKIYAAQTVAIALGAATFSPLFGWIYDRFGSYDYAMLLAGGGYALCGLLILTLGRYPK